MKSRQPHHPPGPMKKRTQGLTRYAYLLMVLPIALATLLFLSAPSISDDAAGTTVSDCDIGTGTGPDPCVISSSDDQPCTEPQPEEMPYTLGTFTVSPGTAANSIPANQQFTIADLNISPGTVNGPLEKSRTVYNCIGGEWKPEIDAVLISDHTFVRYLFADNTSTHSGIAESQNIAVIAEVEITDYNVGGIVTVDAGSVWVEVVTSASWTLSISPSTVNELDGAGAATGTITTPGYPESMTITLSSSDETSLILPVTSLIIPAFSTSATFAIDALNNYIADGDKIVDITATGSLSGSIGTASTGGDQAGQGARKASVTVENGQLSSIECKEYQFSDDYYTEVGGSLILGFGYKFRLRKAPEGDIRWRVLSATGILLSEGQGSPFTYIANFATMLRVEFYIDKDGDGAFTEGEPIVAAHFRSIAARIVHLVLTQSKLSVLSEATIDQCIVDANRRWRNRQSPKDYRCAIRFERTTTIHKITPSSEYPDPVTKAKDFETHNNHVGNVSIVSKIDWGGAGGGVHEGGTTMVLDDNASGKIWAHELGHILQLGHITDWPAAQKPPDLQAYIMYPESYGALERLIKEEADHVEGN